MKSKESKESKVQLSETEENVKARGQSALELVRITAQEGNLPGQPIREWGQGESKMQ